MLYPARVKVGHGSYDYAMLSLEQANQKFVVIDGCLVEQDVVPMRACDVEERLAYEQAEKDIAILTLAKQHYIAVELAKEA